MADPMVRECAIVLGIWGCVTGCGGGQANADAPTTEDGNERAEASDVPVTPEKQGPEGLSDGEKKELGGKCNLIEPDMYDANKQAVATLHAELEKGSPSAAAEKAGLEAGLRMLKEKAKGLDASDMSRCVALFEKRTRRAMFDYEPSEEVARSAVTSCVERVHATVGKNKMSFDMGGSGNPTGGTGPFCPDDFPIPANLSDLPYKSSAEDWDTPAWKCLSFGLRVKQTFQIEYAAPFGENAFQCIARFLPRQGGAPIELVRGGKIQDKELVIDKSITKRRMKAP